MKKKRLNVELDLNTHCQIKRNAAAQNITITTWIMKAIAKKMNEEIELGFKADQ